MPGKGLQKLPFLQISQLQDGFVQSQMLFFLELLDLFGLFLREESLCHQCLQEPGSGSKQSLVFHILLIHNRHILCFFPSVVSCIKLDVLGGSADSKTDAFDKISLSSRLSKLLHLKLSLISARKTKIHKNRLKNASSITCPLN